MVDFFIYWKFGRIFFFKKLFKGYSNKNFFFKELLIGLFFYFIGITGQSQVIYQHDFGTTDIDTHPYNVAPISFDSHLSNSSWENTTNLWTSFTGSSGKAIALRNGSGDPVIILAFTVAPDYQLSLNQFNFWSQRSSTGPTNWAMTVNAISMGSGTISTSGTALGNINVSDEITGLTGNITLQLTLTGATNSVGTFRLDDFTLLGSVTPIITYYRSRQNGNWATPATWETSTNNTTWNIATDAPTKDVDKILIQIGNTVNVASAVSLDQTTIAGTLELKTGGILNINDGSGDDLTISSGGIIKVTSSGNYSASVNQSTNANINVLTNGKVTIGDGSSFTGTGYEGFATSIKNVWNDASVFEYNNNGIFQIADLNYFPNAPSTKVPVFRVLKVNGIAAAGYPKEFHLNGLFELSTDVTFSGSGKKYFRNGIKGTSTLTTLGSGKIILENANAVLDGSSLKLVLSAVMDLAPKTIVPTGANIIISGSNLSNSNGILTINGTLDLKENTITNSSALVILNGTFRTSHPGGFSGSGSSVPSTTGNINVNPNSTIELYANGNQTLNSRTDFNNLIFSGSGIKIPIGSFTPSGTVTIKDNAIFDCSGRNIGDETTTGSTATNLTMSGNSRLIVDTYGPNPKMAGTYNLSGGVVEFKGSNGTAQTIRSKNYQNIEVTGNNVLMSDGNIALNSNGTFIVKSGGVFSINDNTIIGTGDHTQTVKVEGGAIFKCGTNMGFNGAAITPIPIKSSAINKDIENIILQQGSIIDYSRNGDQPITNANGLVYQNVVISGTGNKTAPAGNLIIQGNLSKTSNANFVHNNGTVILNGTNAQSYSSVSPQIVFNNLTNQNAFGLNINDSLSVCKELLLANYSIINLNADISLLSNKDQTASIGQLSTNVNINYWNGRFIVERYINTNTINGGHLKSWQLISTPAFGETIFDTWQEKGSKIISGYGTWITDKSGTINGFDAVSVAPSMKYYDPVTNKWLGISGTGINLENAKGYQVFVRGDRKATTINSTATPTVLRTRGKIYTQGFIPPASTVSPGKFQCVGNPYASAIDFSKITSTNIQSSYTAWDPTLGGNYGVGGYQTISAATNYKAVPGNTTIYNTTSDYRNIQSGQAFFVFNYTASSGSVSFTEACKLSGSQHLVNRVSSIERPVLFANLISEGIITDGNAVAFDQRFSKEIDGDDALKINNARENFAIKRGSKILAVEARKEMKESDSVFYHFNNLSKQQYQLLFVPENMHSELEAYLIDQYLKTEIPVSLGDTTFVNFSVTNDEKSAMPNRFYLVFRTAAAPLAILFSSMNAYPQDENVRVEWKVGNESGIKNYQVEYSFDGIHFSNIGIVNPQNEVVNMYEFIHYQPKPGNNFYRIRINKINGEVEYKNVVKVWMPESTSSIEVYPNPVQNGIIELQFVDQPFGKYGFNLYNSIGQKIFSKEINCESRNSIQSLQPDKNFIQGIYHLEIIKPNGDKKAIKVRK